PEGQIAPDGACPKVAHGLTADHRAAFAFAAWCHASEQQLSTRPERRCRQGGGGTFQGSRPSPHLCVLASPGRETVRASAISARPQEHHHDSALCPSRGTSARRYSVGPRVTDF